MGSINRRFFISGAAASLVFTMAALLAGCAHPSQITANLTFGKKPPGETTMNLKVKNLENSPTTPLRVDVSVQRRGPTGWGKPVPVLHPSPFVLNKKEEHTFDASIPEGGPVRATVTVHEQESGALLKTEVFEQPSK